MGFKIIQLKQRTPEWLEYRRTRIGGSDAPAYMNESPFKTPLQLYMDKVFGADRSATPAMRRGNDLEPAALEWFNFRMSPPYFTPLVIESTEHEGFMASLDGLRHVNDGVEICEIKCPGEIDHLEALAGIVPAKYRAQLDHNLLVSGAKICWYVSYDGLDGVVLPYKYDPMREAAIIAKGRAFLDCIRTKTPPPSSDRDVTEIIDPEANELAKKYIEVCNEIEMLEKQRDLLKQDLLEYTEGDRTNIGPLMISRFDRKGLIDYSKIPVLQSMNLDPYRKPSSTTWKITVKSEE
jgi:putative phage-type endonuclease